MNIAILIFIYLLIGWFACVSVSCSASKPKGRWLLVLFWPFVAVLVFMALMFLLFIKIVFYIAESVTSWMK